MRSTKRDEIVAAATDLIRSDGVRAASIAKIIAASGSSAGSVYHHFENKNDIVLAVARGALVEPLEAALAAHEDEALAPGALLRLMAGAVLDGLDDELARQVFAAVIELWRHVLRTNFYLADRFGLAFRLAPGVIEAIGGAPRPDGFSGQPGRRTLRL